MCEGIGGRQNLRMCVCVRNRGLQSLEGFSFVCILEEREIHRRQLRLGICSKRLYGSLGNRARMRESERGSWRERERERLCVCVCVY